MSKKKNKQIYNQSVDFTNFESSSFNASKILIDSNASKNSKLKIRNINIPHGNTEQGVLTSVAISPMNANINHK